MTSVPAISDVNVVQPYPAVPFYIGRVAARSPAFKATSATGGLGVVVGSAAGCDPAEVRVRARAELIERVSNILAARRAERAAECLGSYSDLRRRGLPVVDPAMWSATVGTSPEELRAMPMMWVHGRRVNSGPDDVLVPASAVFLHHTPPEGCNLMVRATSTGLAAGRDQMHAFNHALTEIIERDLLFRSWYWGAPAPQPADAGAASARLLEILDDLGLKASVFHIAGEKGVTCVVAAVHTPDETQQAFGARCASTGSPELVAATDTAICEALMVHWSMSTAVARRAWVEYQDMKAHNPGAAWPRNPLEHAALAFHSSTALRELRRRSKPGAESIRPSSTAPTCDDFGNAETIFCDTAVLLTGGEPLAVIRVLVPSAFDLTSAHHAPDKPLGLEIQPHPFG
ncbi:YcaO-like family protein [Nonomuraea sp. NPDC003201]